MQEREMTNKDKAKEKRLKKKYDDSDMKKSMKKQYGDDWKNVYYATIRKKAMENKIDEALKYEYMVLDQDGRVMGMSTNYRDAEQNARGDNLLGITGRVVKLKRPMSQGRGDRLMGQLPADNLGEGYQVLPNIDKERYTPIQGMEGPFMTVSGKTLYYDPQEGSYYDRDTDMFLTYDEFKQYDEPRTPIRSEAENLVKNIRAKVEGHSPHAKGTPKYKKHMAAMHANSAEPKGKMLEGMVKVTNIKWDSDDDVSDLSTTMMVPVPSGMDQDGAEEFIADYITDKTGVTHDGFRISEGVKRNAIYQQVGKMLAKGHSMDAIKKRFADLDKANPGYLEKIAQALKDRNEIPYDKYKSIKGAVESVAEAKKTKHRVTVEQMKEALSIDDDTSDEEIVASYVRTMLDESMDTWSKVFEEVQFVLSILKEGKSLNPKNVQKILMQRHMQEYFDDTMNIKENVDTLRKIVNDKQYQTVKFNDGSMKVDLTTASLFLQVFDKQRPEIQEKIKNKITTKQGFLAMLDLIYGKM